MKRLIVILLLVLAGCKTTEFAEPPADKLVCPEEPEVPAEPVTDQKNATYLTEMRGAWAGCKEDVDWLRAWFRDLNR